MNYRSISDLNEAIVRGFPRLPADIDLVVGVPRSGLLAANLYALVANIALVDLEGFLAGRVLATGRSRPLRPSDAARHRVLVIDDSINSGSAMREARSRITDAGLDLAACTFCAVYGTDRYHPDADIVLERVPRPRVFQWNLFHHKHLAHGCVDLDGVLCPDTPNLAGRVGQGTRPGAPLQAPSALIGHIVTARPEGERAATEEWLAVHAIRYRTLHMPPDGAAGDDPVARKAAVYRRTAARLFVASGPEESDAIARLSGKPVLCLQTQTVRAPRPAMRAGGTGLRDLPLRVRLATGGPRPWREIARANLNPRVLAGLKRSAAVPRLVLRRIGVAGPAKDTRP